MAFPFTPLRSKEVKELLGLIEKQWGRAPDWSSWAAFRSAKDNLYLASRDVGRLPLDRLRVTAIGCYIGEFKHGELRLSIEGSQLIGPLATRNMADLTSAEAEAWMKGQDLGKQGDWSGFVIVRHGKDCLGSGKYKDGKLLNFVPKTRRLTELAMALAEESDEHIAGA